MQSDANSAAGGLALKFSPFETPCGGGGSCARAFGSGPSKSMAAIVAALQPVFLVASAIAALAFLLTLGLREIPLRGMGAAEGLGESFAMPRDATSIEELERIVTTLSKTDHDVVLSVECASLDAAQKSYAYLRHLIEQVQGDVD